MKQLLVPVLVQNVNEAKIDDIQTVLDKVAKIMSGLSDKNIKAFYIKQYLEQEFTAQQLESLISDLEKSKGGIAKDKRLNKVCEMIFEPVSDLISIKGQINSIVHNMFSLFSDRFTDEWYLINKTDTAEVNYLGEKDSFKQFCKQLMKEKINAQTAPTAPTVVRQIQQAAQQQAQAELQQARADMEAKFEEEVQRRVAMAMQAASASASASDDPMGSHHD